MQEFFCRTTANDASAVCAALCAKTFFVKMSIITVEDELSASFGSTRITNVPKIFARNLRHLPQYVLRSIPEKILWHFIALL